MKKTLTILAALLVCGGAFAAQDTELVDGYAEVRDPVRLKAWLEANAADAESRIAAIEGGTATVTQTADTLLVGNDASNQVAMAVTGDVTISQDGTNVTTAITSGAIVPADLNTALQDSLVTLTLTGADAESAGTGTITIQAKDAAGNDLDEQVLVRTWIGTADDFGPDALTDYSVSTGTQLQEVTANAHYTAISDTNGVIVMAVDNGGAATNYAWAVIQGKVYSSGAVEFTAP